MVHGRLQAANCFVTSSFAVKVGFFFPFQGQCRALQVSGGSFLYVAALFHISACVFILPLTRTLLDRLPTTGRRRGARAVARAGAAGRRGDDGAHGHLVCEK